MKLQELIDQSYQKFLEEASRASVILLHPRSRYRSVLVAKLVNSPDIKTFYYALNPDDVNLLAFLYSIAHDLANQHPTFGRHLNTLPPGVYENIDGNFDRIVDTFVDDLQELSPDPFMLVLDEYDRSDTADDVQDFIEKVAGRLPDHCRIVLNSRTLPRLPWVSLIAKRRAVLLEDNEIITRNFYGLDENQEESRFEIYGLGPGFVLVDGQVIDAWEGHLPRLLFFFALDRPVITRSEICQAFWPDLDPDQAVNVFHVTKRRLHKALDTDVLVHGEGYYRINSEMTIYYDAMDFVTSLIAARDETNPNRIDAWQRVIDLYRGPFLQGHSDEWILDRRRDFRIGYLDAMMHMAQVWFERERYDQALSLLNKALAEDYSREDIHRELMRLYANVGRRSEAAGHFQQLGDYLKSKGLSPAEETQALYAEIMA